MTDISSAKFGSDVGNKFAKHRMRFAVEESYWGYVIRSTDSPRITLQILQAAAMIVGASFAAGAIGLVVLPDFLAGGTEFAFRAGAAVIFAGIATFLLWYATRGTQVELHVDTSLGEIREVVRNRAGRSTKLGSYGFDAIGGVFIDRSDLNPNNASLLLRFGNTSQTASVATGAVAQLEPLKDRLGQDLIIGEASLA